MSTLEYEQIAQSLQTRISHGEFGPGDVLPSGRDLSAQWSVSRATVIKAMDVLRNQGLVVARQGTGFMVAETSGVLDVGREASRRSRTPAGGSVRRLGVPEKRCPPLPTARALGLRPGERAVCRRRLMLSKDGRPEALVSAWFPPEAADDCPRLLLKALIEGGEARYVAQTVGRPMAEGRELISARLVEDEEAEVLDLESPAAVVVDLLTSREAVSPTPPRLVHGAAIPPRGVADRPPSP